MHDDYDGFFRTEYPDIVLAAQMILQDRQAAEDATQEAFVRLYRHWGRISRYDRPEAWVRQVTIRIAVKEVRRRKLREALLLRGDTEHVDRLYDPDLMNAIAQLSARQRAATVLFYLEDRSTSEVAEILDCSEGTAAVHLHRARRKLALLLGDAKEPKEAEGVA